MSSTPSDPPAPTLEQLQKYLEVAESWPYGEATQWLAWCRSTLENALRQHQHIQDLGHQLSSTLFGPKT